MANQTMHLHLLQTKSMTPPDLLSPSYNYPHRPYLSENSNQLRRSPRTASSQSSGGGTLGISSTNPLCRPTSFASD
ncbi:hypothetical protein U1Q18_003508, partial [Sarracenia purpurea var. burkii]